MLLLEEVHGPALLSGCAGGSGGGVSARRRYSVIEVECRRVYAASSSSHPSPTVRCRRSVPRSFVGTRTLYILYSSWAWTIYIAGMGVGVARDAVRHVSL